VQFLSDEWVAAFNDALVGLEPELAGVDGSLAAAGGRFRVTQRVSGVPPDGRTVEVTLVVTEGRAALDLGTPEAAGPGVVVALAYRDAAAMSRGDLSPAEALGDGRIKVRGDLSLLVASQPFLAAAAERVAGLAPGTTY